MRRKSAPRWLQAARAAGKEFDSKQTQEPTRWLSRALSRSGALPLGEAERAIREGRVRLRGRVTTEPFAPLSRGDEVTLDGKVVDTEGAVRVLMFHKPAGVVTAKHDPERQGTVFEALRVALPSALQGYEWHAVGRLDRDTTGLLFFTNDASFVAHATSPESHLAKRYLARVGGKVTPEKLRTLAEGLDIDGKRTRPAKAEALGESRVALTLTEGRHHQVKRMLGAVGLPVLELHRDRIGTLALDIDVGSFRELTPSEIKNDLGYAGLPGLGGAET